MASFFFAIFTIHIMKLIVKTQKGCIMKLLYKLGTKMAQTGAAIWEKNSKTFSNDSTAEEQWSDLSWKGKFGFKLMVAGFKIAGITPEMIDTLVKR